VQNTRPFKHNSKLLSKTDTKKINGFNGLKLNYAMC